MLKTVMFAAGLCALAAALPATAQDAAQANQCKAASTAAEGSEFKDNVRTAREHGSRAAVGRRRGVKVGAGDVNSDGNSEAYDAGFRGGVTVAAGDVNGDGATSGGKVIKKATLFGRKSGDDASTEGARMKCQNNLKQISLGAH